MPTNKIHTSVKQWLETEYPQICQAARCEGAEIHWGDEMGVRSDYQAGHSYGRVGKTPVIPATGQRFSCNMISTTTNRGKLCFKLFTQRFDSAVMLNFLRRLIRHSSHVCVFDCRWSSGASLGVQSANGWKNIKIASACFSYLPIAPNSILMSYSIMTLRLMQPDGSAPKTKLR